jgi:Trypsin-like peptidase domain
MTNQPHRLFLFLLVACACAVAHAQCYTDPFTGQRICTRQILPSQPAANIANVDPTAHCRVFVADGTMGSGTLIGANDSVGLVLTCSHLFDCSKSGIIVTFPNGRRYAANLVDLDRANDLGALEIRRPTVEPLTVSDTDPTGVLVACGFGPNGAFRAISGNITGHPTASGATYASTTIAGAVRSGDSGGGVLDMSGHVVGIVWGQRDGQTYATCGQPLREFLARIRSKIFGSAPVAVNKPTDSQPTALPGVHSPEFDWPTWTSELDSRLRAIDAKKQDKGDYLRPGDLNRYLKADDATKITDQFPSRAEIESKLKGFASQFESVHNVVESIRTHIDELAGDRASIVEGASLAKYAVGALGLSGPLAAAVIIAGGLFGRRLKSRVTRLETVLAPTLNTKPSTLNPIAIDTPPPPQRTVPETHYVPIEKDSFAKAHQWASEHVARKYPGATEVLQAQDSLIKQFLAAK